MKDYYKLLNLPRDAEEKDIKKAYRQLALKYHPDRNPGDKEAENRFKDIAEAYSILIDPEKRQQYDMGARYGYAQADEQFSFRGEDIFSAFFRDPRHRAFINELQKEFEKQGVRFDEDFLNNLFTRGGGFVFGSIFTSGPDGMRYRTFGHKGFSSLRQSMRPGTPDRTSPPVRLSLGGIAEKIGQKIGIFLSQWFPEKFPTISAAIGITDKDIHYRITLSAADATRGKQVVITYPRGYTIERVAVKVPPGIKNGTKLKLRQMGLPTNEGHETGDLYVQILIQ